MMTAPDTQRRAEEQSANAVAARLRAIAGIGTPQPDFTAHNIKLKPATAFRMPHPDSCSLMGCSAALLATETSAQG